MNIDSKSKSIILLGNDVLTEDGLFVFLEAIDFKIKSYTVMPDNLKFYVDESIYDEILKLEGENKRQEFIRIKGILNILVNLNVLNQIDTSTNREFREFFELKNKYPLFDLHLLTNLESSAKKCHMTKEDIEVNIERIDEDKLVSWGFEEIVKKEEVKDESKKEIVDEVEAEINLVDLAPRLLEEAFFTTEKDQLVHISDQAEFKHVYSEKYGFLTLDQDNVMFGGEGKIYRTYENLLVKIYSRDERRYETIKKIQLMIDSDLRNKYIVWPKDIVYNNNEFVGYVMEEILDAKGLDMYRIYSFQNISYRERIMISIDLLKMIDYLHEREILVGDLKFDNILYTNKTKELFIIDSGSFQIEDYSCGVFNADYTHDNLKGKNLREILRTLEEEYFPINKILFEVLMGKGPFYDFITGEVGSDVERRFHYPIEDFKEIKDLNDPLFYWVNSDERLRYAFHDYFSKGIVTNVKEWIDLLEDIISKGAR